MKEELLQPSDSAPATAIAAAFNLARPHKSIKPAAEPSGESRKTMLAWAQLLGDCAKRILRPVGEE